MQCATVDWPCTVGCYLLLSTSKLFFAFSLAHCFFASLRLGATTILDPKWPDPSNVSSMVERFKPTVMLSVPTFYRSLLRKNLATERGFKNVRYYLTAGEKMPASLFNDWISFVPAILLANFVYFITLYYSDFSINYLYLFKNSIFTFIFYPILWVVFSLILKLMKE